jgi:hypothetical protein
VSNIASEKTLPFLCLRTTRSHSIFVYLNKNIGHHSLKSMLPRCQLVRLKNARTIPSPSCYHEQQRSAARLCNDMQD